MVDEGSASKSVPGRAAEEDGKQRKQPVDGPKIQGELSDITGL
jgi:hypothetical protein